jgi:hypothetical protein
MGHTLPTPICESLSNLVGHQLTHDRSLHWPHILQILVPTFSAFSVAQGYVSSDPNQKRHTEDLDHALEDAELDALGEEAAERRRRIEEEKQGRTCPICLSKPVAARMTKCGHVRLPLQISVLADDTDLLLPLHSPLYPTLRRP